MERSQHQAILLLVGVGLLATVACAAAESCDARHLAAQLDSFCRPGEESYHHHGTACCKAVRSSVDMSLTVDPLCICRLEEEPAFIVSARGLVGIYVACGGRNSTGLRELVADRCFAPPPQQQHGPVLNVEAIYADQPTPH